MSRTLPAPGSPIQLRSVRSTFCVDLLLTPTRNGFLPSRDFHRLICCSLIPHSSLPTHLHNLSSKKIETRTSCISSPSMPSSSQGRSACSLTSWGSGSREFWSEDVWPQSGGLYWLGSQLPISVVRSTVSRHRTWPSRPLLGFRSLLHSQPPVLAAHATGEAPPCRSWSFQLWEFKMGVCACMCACVCACVYVCVCGQFRVLDRSYGRGRSLF